jgi:hypothetical protein
VSRVYFLFYFLYLIGAQFPLFLLLTIRNMESNQNMFLYMFLSSLFVLLILLGFVRARMVVKNKLKSNVVISSENLANTTMSDFLSFFLLPFFTFNLISNNQTSQQLFEMLFILLLLTIFLHRSENLLINPLIFIFFNLYKGTSPGSNYSIIMPKHRTSVSVESENKDNFVRITNKIVVYYSNANDYGSIIKFLNRSLIIISVIFVCCVLFAFNIYPSVNDVLSIMDSQK